MLVQSIRTNLFLEFIYFLGNRFLDDHHFGRRLVPTATGTARFSFVFALLVPFGHRGALLPNGFHRGGDAPVPGSVEAALATISYHSIGS